MHQLGPLDVLATAAAFGVALVVDRLGRRHFRWLEDGLYPQRLVWLRRHPTPPRGVEEDNEVHWNWGGRS